jgi:hypothetical protein
MHRAAVMLAVLGCGCGTSSPGTANHVVATTGPPSTTTSTAADASLRRFVVEPVALEVGAPVTFSGTACPAGDVARVSIDATSTTAGTQADDIPPRADGSWTATVTVGDSTLLGTRVASAVCASRSRHDVVFAYAPVTVRVRTYRRLQVDPSRVVSPGDRLTVAATAGCPAQPLGTGATFGIASPTRFVVDGIDVAVGVETAPFDRKWTGAVVVPETTRPGSYLVVAYCTYARSYAAWYESVPIVVRRAP